VWGLEYSNYETIIEALADIKSDDTKIRNNPTSRLQHYSKQIVGWD
jgi:hypothetical protein